jgi:hypothetical protein
MKQDSLASYEFACSAVRQHVPCEYCAHHMLNMLRRSISGGKDVQRRDEIFGLGHGPY